MRLAAPSVGRKRAGAQHHVVGVEIVGRLAQRLLQRDLLQARRQRAGDSAGDALLHGEDVAQLVVVLLGPQLRAVGGVAELHRDPHALAHAPHTAAHDVAGIQRPADLGERQLLVPERQDGVVGDHRQLLEAAERPGDVLGEAVGEIVLGGIAALVGEHQDGD